MTKPRERRSSIQGGSFAPARPANHAGEAAQALEVLVAIADLGSFTAAAERVGLTPSAVSKAVTRSEARLGVRLVQRTTRRVSFTDVGEAYVIRARRLLVELEGLEREAASRDQGVRGTLRVSAPAVYGALQVAPRLALLQKKHPALEVQLRCEDRLIDMVAERIDVAVRMLTTPPAEFVAKVLAEDRRGLYACPAYLRHTKLPETVEDLEGHAMVAYSGVPTVRPPWKRGRVVFSTDSVLAAREAALGGVGITELPEYLAQEHLLTGRLREVLPGSLPVVRRIYAVYLPSRFLPPLVRACVDVLVDRSSGPVRAPQPRAARAK